MIPPLPPLRSIARADFNAKARSLGLMFSDEPNPTVALKPKRFASGAVGWSSGNQIVYVQVGETWLRCRCVVTLRVVDSHRWPEVSNENA